MKTKSGQIFWSVWNIIESFLLSISGILCILFRDQEKLIGIVGFLIGAFVVLDGFCRAIVYFTGFSHSEESEALLGGFEAALGAVICLQHANFIVILIQFLYCVLIIVGTLILIMSIIKIAKHRSTLFMPILTIIFGAILCGLGLTIFLIYEFTSSESKVLVMILIGSILILVGGAQFVITIIQTIKAAAKTNNIVPTKDFTKPEYGKAKAVNDDIVVENAIDIKKIKGN